MIIQLVVQDQAVTTPVKFLFADSEIAAKFSCGEKKTAYMSVFGLAEHFMELLKKDKPAATSVILLEHS